MDTVNCIRCDFAHEDNGNCTVVGGFCTAVPAAHCPLLRKYLDTGLTPEQCENAKVIIESRPEPTHAHLVVNWLGDCRCSYCETFVDCTEPFCQHCGARLDEPEEKEDEPNGRPDYT